MGTRAKVRMASSVDYAWAAGFIEADGCIHLAKQKFPTAHIIVVQRDVRPLNRLQAIFGTQQKIGQLRKRYKNTHVVYYRWQCSGALAATILQKILPYLDHKRELAQVALDLCQSVANNASKRGQHICTPQSIIDYRHGLVVRARILTHHVERLSEEAPLTGVLQ